jgi:hypothetical protein
MDRSVQVGPRDDRQSDCEDDDDHEETDRSPLHGLSVRSAAARVACATTGRHVPCVTEFETPPGPYAARGRPRTLAAYTPFVSPTRLLWAVAVVLAVAVVGMSYLDRSHEATWTVIVAKQRIPAGVIVNPSMYDLVTMPKGEVEVGTITDLTYLPFHQVAHPIYPGEVLVAFDFLPRSRALQRPPPKA